MLKKIAIALMLILPMGLAAQTFKFGHIASQEIMVLMPEYTKAMADLEALQKKYTEELQTITDELNKKFSEFQAAQNEGNLPANIQERRQREIQEMMERREQFEQDAYTQMRKTSDELTAPILQKLDKAIKDVGAAEGMTYIFDLSRTYIPYINENQSTDLTAKVKSKLGI
ncbi:OmpH family outer membrane protein [Bacteroides sp. 519]|uniref:OmpH family outer membrane protein n=1 Tax=Bacteroides sp. 519 TaxID=2302937 RepID=UPI0013D1084C|nr:OmpH family outer membrane protein [Bacteroides sp. 519]NDV57168.1 OmpH family outer membrane protein [Bacteroides sp. 519]